HYLTYFDTAIMEYFRWVGYDYTSEVKATGLDFHVVRSVIEYKAPIRFDEEIDVAVRVDRIGQSSLRFVLAIFGGVFHSLRATGEIVYVYTDQVTHEATRIGDDFRALIASKDSPAT